MACLVKRGEIWYVQYKANGKYVRASTKTSSKKIALEVLRQYQVEESKEYNDLPTRRSRCTLGELTKKYLHHIQGIFSPRWFEIKEWMLNKHILPFFGADTPLKEISQEKIESYQRKRLADLKPRSSKKKPKDGEENKKPTTIKARTVNIEVHHVLLAMLRKAAEWKLMPKTAVPSVKKLQEGEGRVRFLSEEEASRLREKAAALSTEMETFVMLGIYAGLRAGESLALRWADIDFHLRTLTISPRHDWTPKTRKTRIIPITDDLFNYLRPLRQDKKMESLVIGLDYNAASRRFKRLVKATGLPTEGELRVNTHVLRHSFASHLIMNGVPLYTVAALLGHSSTETTRLYAHLAPNHLQQAVSGLSYQGKPVE